jgi:hypothetical protein
VVSRAAWVLPPGAVGRPWLECFDLDAETEVGADLLQAAHAALGGPTLYHAAVPANWRQKPVAAQPMEAARLGKITLCRTGPRADILNRYPCAPGRS